VEGWFDRSVVDALPNDMEMKARPMLGDAFHSVLYNLDLFRFTVEPHLRCGSMSFANAFS
ncbi:MAG: hypothetical protein PUD50_12890, partial [Eubacteriales bacterium]|nr:hypothetical protein [Eubacteriales bacterium]